MASLVLMDGIAREYTLGIQGSDNDSHKTRLMKVSHQHVGWRTVPERRARGSGVRYVNAGPKSDSSAD